jgi:branched-chain amino acid transport system ATP-binding protein
VTGERAPARSARENSMALLAVNDLTKSFGALRVADAISFEVAKGEALGIIGPNGAGKSTLFNLVTGGLAPDAGRVSFAGKDITGTSPMQRARAGIGRSFQIPQPFQKLTVFENLVVATSFGRGLPERAATEVCASILETTGLMRRANLPAGQLSLLERKRLELARALATGPELLLLDEIAGGLTEGECDALVATIRDIHAGGVTIVWIEHVLHALTRVVSRLMVLDFGKVIATGAPDEIMASREVREIYLGIDV